MYITEYEALKDLDKMIQAHIQTIHMLESYATSLKKIKGDVDSYHAPDLEALFHQGRHLAMEMDDVLQKLRELRASMDMDSKIHHTPLVYGPNPYFGP